jgi:cytoskeletal protein CcmA (bactofilin family)
MFGKKKDTDDMSKNDTTGRDAPADLPAPRTYTPRAEPLSGAGRAPLADPPRRLPDVGAPPPRRTEARAEPRDSRPASSSDIDAKKLIVGRGIFLTGEIRACDRLVVEGRVEAVLADSRSIEIAESGLFKGNVQIDSAEISGRFEGEITVKHRLTVHSTGRVIGTIRYGEIEIERGGILSGTVELLGDDGTDVDYQGDSSRAGGSTARAGGNGAAGHDAVK